MSADVLIVLLRPASLSSCKNSDMHYVMVGTPAARKPLTAVKAATASRSNYYYFHSFTSLTTAETLGYVYADQCVTSIIKL